jgi:hypothetical protein
MQDLRVGQGESGDRRRRRVVAVTLVGKLLAFLNRRRQRCRRMRRGCEVSPRSVGMAANFRPAQSHAVHAVGNKSERGATTLYPARDAGAAADALERMACMPRRSFDLKVVLESDPELFSALEGSGGVNSN